MSESYRSRSGSGRQTAARSSSQSLQSSRKESSDRLLASRNTRTSSGRSSSARRTATSTSARRRARRRNQGPDLAKILLIGIGIIIFLICVAVGLRGCSFGRGTEETTGESQTETETEMEAEITINGVSVHGLTKTQAKEKVMESINWSMTVTYDGNTAELPNLMESNVDAVLEEAFSSGQAGDYTLSTEGLEETISSQVDTLASQWDVQPKNGSISSYDAASDQFVFSEEENGLLIDRESLVSAITAAVASGDFGASLTATATSVEPEITREEARENFQRIGAFTNTTTSN